LPALVPAAKAGTMEAIAVILLFLVAMGALNYLEYHRLD
jgi:hypothetical protein